jgi:hypothetical protein
LHQSSFTTFLTLVNGGRRWERAARHRSGFFRGDRLWLVRFSSITAEYLGLLRTITDDYGGKFAAQSDSLTYRTVGIYVFPHTVTCSPVRARQIAHALKLPRATALRKLQELAKDSYVERVGNAYRVTDKVNISDLQNKLQRRIDMVAETAKRLSELRLHPPRRNEISKTRFCAELRVVTERTSVQPDVPYLAKH